MQSKNEIGQACMVVQIIMICAEIYDGKYCIIDQLQIKGCWGKT